MNKTMLYGAVICALCIDANAQSSSVASPAELPKLQMTNTIYGAVDLGFTYVNNIGGKSAEQLTSVGVQGSRLGFRGNIVIDPELSGLYVLEAGFNPENGTLGQGGRLFGRQVFAGLSHTKYGQMLFGRQYDSLVDYVQPVTANGTVGGPFFSHPYDNDNTDNTVRFNNVLKWRSPESLGPVGISVSHGFSNQPGGNNNNSMTSVGLGYTAKGLKVGTGYLVVNNGGLGAANANASGTATSDQIFVSARRETVWGLGGNYLLGRFKLGAVYTRSDYQDVNQATTTGVSYKFNNYEVNLSYYATPKLTLSTALMRTNANVTGKGPGFANPTWNQLGFIADYQIAKGLFLYGELAHQKAGGSPFAVASDGGPAAKIHLVTASSTNSQTLARAGLRYNF